MRKTLEHFNEVGVDSYLYAGPIEKSGYDSLCQLLEDKKKGRKALLFLVTGGGNPNAGYRIARALCHHYGSENFRVAIPAECKSAGTLICIGAHSLVLFDKGELGPLDVQFQKQDEIFQQSSGLDILRGMTYLRQEALETFNEFLLDINGGSGLSTKTASEIASKLVIGLFEPMFAQIDPIRLGEMNAALQIANEYGNRLHEKSKSLKTGALAKLINNYPTHGFVIDRAEARKLFERVESPTEHEQALAEWAMRVASGNPYRNQPKVIDLLDFFEDIFPKEPSNVGQPTPGAEGNPSAQTAYAGTADPGTPEGTGVKQPPIEGKPGNV
jgi:hypothetical protein